MNSRASTPVTRRLTRAAAAFVAIVLAAIALQGATLAVADASPTARVMVNTQRMSAATLNSTQNGWYSAGSTIALSCYARGQSVKGYYSAYISGGWDNLWYRVSDGYYVADVDINTGTDDPVTGACTTAPPPSQPAPSQPAPSQPAPSQPAPSQPAPSQPAPSSSGSAVALDTSHWYTLVARNSGKNVDVRGGSSANGSALQQYPGNGTPAQRFRFIATDSGYYRVVGAHSDTEVWDVTGGNGANGALVQTWAWGAGLNQQWLPVSAPNGYVSFKPRHSTSRCLDVPGGSSNSSVQLQIYSCNGTSSQQFALTSAGTLSQGNPAEITQLAKDNIGRNDCSTNSLGGTGYYNSCNGEAWCADFAKWMWANSGYSVAGVTAAAGSFEILPNTVGIVHTSTSYAPQVGDAVVFNYKGNGVADHVGIVSFVNSDGSIQTIQGNLGSAVRMLTVPQSQARVGQKVTAGGLLVGNYVAAYISAFVTPVG